MAKMITVKVASYSVTEMEGLFDVVLKGTKRPYKSYVVRLDASVVGNPPAIGREISLDVTAASKPAKAPQMSIGSKVATEGANTLVPPPGTPPERICPLCGGLLKDGPTKTCRVTTEGLTIATDCTSCSYSGRRKYPK